MYTVVIEFKRGIKLAINTQGVSILADEEGVAYGLYLSAVGLLSYYEDRYSTDVGNAVDYLARNIARDLNAVAITYPKTLVLEASEIVY